MTHPVDRDDARGLVPKARPAVARAAPEGRP